VIPNNACHLCITAAAGTELAVTSFGLDQSEDFLTPDSSLHPEGLHPTRGVAGSGFRPLPNIRYCSPPWRSGQCLSSDVAGRSLNPATRRRLGEPLPHQQADRKQAAPKPMNLWLSFMRTITSSGITAPFGNPAPILTSHGIRLFLQNFTKLQILPNAEK
jgi:hypothetical protein